MSECSHKLCRADAVEPVDVVDARAACLFLRGGDPDKRHYELCREHFDSYFPRGHGWMDRVNATRLRIQCRPMEGVPS